MVPAPRRLARSVGADYDDEPWVIHVPLRGKSARGSLRMGPFGSPQLTGGCLARSSCTSSPRSPTTPPRCGTGRHRERPFEAASSSVANGAKPAPGTTTAGPVWCTPPRRSRASSRPSLDAHASSTTASRTRWAGSDRCPDSPRPPRQLDARAARTIPGAGLESPLGDRSPSRRNPQSTPLSRTSKGSPAANAVSWMSHRGALN